ncbi:helix-turn-helix domain-containing protein [Streptomyces caniscabiei]|uniref:Helix-turn-helix domain-containing protein n=1 Tax=Streptomyces caniscabiei TaxID=2746961 RepID=A0ABU4MG25_9ACTN|nr:helix-turn-helix domain-containing protein [Streptomyces caniscabiei]MDX2943300.1 helix-turn-helix domain-containing protein [Streptomyces caniscabiei]MDX3036421.1 helix-turn-helix domain-containing protein [Streptomyces caniscabiei]
MRKSAVDVLEEDEWLTPSEAAKLAKLTVRTLSDRRWKKTGPPYRKLSPGKGGRVRYRRSDVLAWLQGEQKASAA